MRIVYLLSFSLAFLATFAQTPKFINYQGIARDASGNPIVNQSVNLSFTITNGILPAYTDNKLTNTNAFGLFNTTIGSASNPITSNLSSGSYNLIVSINGNVLSPQNLASVPYALHAETASSAPAPTVNFSGGVLSVGGNTTSIPGGSVYSAGSAINISTTGVISNVSPDQTVTITSSGVATVNSSYPFFNVGVPNPSLSFSNLTNILTLTQGTFATTASLTGSGSSTVTITGTNNAVVTPTTGTSFMINVPTQTFTQLSNTITSNLGGTFILPASINTTLTGINNAIVTPTIGNNFSVNVPLQNFTVSTNTVTSNLGGNFIIPTQSLTLSGSTLTSGPSSNSVNLAGVIGNDWSLNGNAGTIFGSNNLGTTDNNAMSIITNSLSRIGINTSTISGAGGVVIGGNTSSASLGKDLTLQGGLSASTSDQTYGHFAIRGGNLSSANQAFMSFNNSIAGVVGYIGDRSASDNDLYLHAASNLRLSASGATANPVFYVNGASNNIAIGGFTSPVAKLDVQATHTAAAINGINNGFTTSTFAYGVYGETNSSSAQGAAIKGNNLSVGAGVSGVNFTGGASADAHGVFGETNSTAVNAYGVFGRNSGTGSGVYGRATSTTAINAYGVYGQNIGIGAGVSGINTGSISNNNAHGVLGLTQNANPSAAGVYGANDGAGPSILAEKTGTSTGNVLKLINANSSNNTSVLFATTSALSGGTAGEFNASNGNAILATNNSNSFATISAINSGIGNVINTSATGTGNGINVAAVGGFGIDVSNNGGNPAIRAINNGGGVSLFLSKTGTAGGNVGYFENLSSTNTAAVINAVNNSSIQMSPVINAASNSTIASIGVQLQNSHLKSIGGLTATITHTNSFGGLPAGGYNITPINCTDVKGTILIANPSFTTTPSGALADFVVPFNKPYGTTPIIILTQQFTGGEISKFTIQLLSTGSNDFTFRLVNLTAAPIILTGTEQIKLNYFVIE